MGLVRPGKVACVRRLLILCSAVVLVDTMLYAALTPLLPELADRFGLSKGGSGLLVAAFAVGALAAALPSGVAAARLGPKISVLSGLALMSLASLGFGIASEPWALGAARFLQGAGSTLSWAGAFTWLVALAPRDRRGQTLGTAIGAAVVGALLGPVLGSIASVVGIGPAFIGVSLLGLGLLAWTLATPGATPEPQRLRELRRVLRPSFVGGLWLMLLPALLFGVVTVLVPLELADHGWGAAAIGAVFLAGAGLEAVLHPLVGRYSDRRGRLIPVRLALVASFAVSLALAWASASVLVVALTIAALVSFGGFYAPASAYISDAADRAGLAQGLAFGVVNGAWALGNAVGPAAGGGLADVAGDALPYMLCAAVSLVTLALVQRAGTLVARAPELPS